MSGSVDVGREVGGGGGGVRRAASFRALLAVALAGAICPLPARAQDPQGEALPVVEHTLENGMRFLVLRREGAPTVAFVTQYNVGSVHEVLGYTGIAHLLEHMLFKGTTTIGTRDHESERELFPLIDAVQDTIRAERSRREGPDGARLAQLQNRLAALEDSARVFVESNEFDRIFTRNGARSLNASTSYESTTYYVELPANRAKLWFVLEADRVRNPVFREFYAERSVVAEERRMRVESDPGGLLWEAFLAAAYRVHPYGVPVIGHMSDIQNFHRRQAEEYYRRFYGPNNAVVAVVGDISPDSIRAWAEAYLGGVPAGDTPAPVLAREPEQRGERRVEVVYDAEPQLLMGWRAVDPLHPDYPALLVLGSVLAGGTTSRLHRRLVLEERTALSVSASLVPGALDPLLFVVGAAPRAPHTTAELERAVEEELARLRDAPPDPLEIQRIRNQLEAGAVRRLRSNFGLAFQLAESEAFHDDWRTTFRFSRQLAEVSPEDVQRVARTYFSRETRTVGMLVRAARAAEVIP